MFLDCMVILLCLLELWSCENLALRDHFYDNKPKDKKQNMKNMMPKLKFFVHIKLNACDLQEGTSVICKNRHCFDTPV